MNAEDLKAQDAAVASQEGAEVDGQTTSISKEHAIESAKCNQQI